MTRQHLLKMSKLATEIGAVLLPLSANMGKDSHGGKMQAVEEKLAEVAVKAEELARLANGG